MTANANNPMDVAIGASHTTTDGHHNAGMPRPRSHEIVVRQVGRVTEHHATNGVVLHLPDAVSRGEAAGVHGAARDEYPAEGTVLAIGSAVRDVAVGDYVFFERRDGVHALWPDTRVPGCPPAWVDLLIMTEGHVMMVGDK